MHKMKIPNLFTELVGRKACYGCQQQMLSGMHDLKENKQYLPFSK